MALHKGRIRVTHAGRLVAIKQGFAHHKKRASLLLQKRQREPCVIVKIATMSSDRKPSARNLRWQRRRQQQQQLEQQQQAALDDASTASTVSSILASNRRTRSSLATAAAVSADRSAAAARPTKKARISSTASTEVRPAAAPRYLLRSSSSAAAAVTPAPRRSGSARHLNFSSQRAPPAAATVGDGVVDLFDESQPRTPRPTCNCPCSTSLEAALGVAHFFDYGQEWLGILRAEEARQVSSMRSLLPSVAANDGDEESVDDDSSEDEESDEDISVARPVARSRVLHLDEASSSSADASSKDPMRPLPVQPLLSPNMRGILVNWLAEVSHEYSVSETAFQLAVTLLDHVLARGPTEAELQAWQEGDQLEEPTWFLVKRHEFQAVGWYVGSEEDCVGDRPLTLPLSFSACMWIASKMEDKSPPSVDDFVYISDHSFTSNYLRLIEEKICRLLEFRLHRVTPMHFVNYLLRASHACPSRGCQFDHVLLRRSTEYLLSLSRLSWHLSSHTEPSRLAAAAVYLARATIGITQGHAQHRVDAHGYWTKTLEYYSGYSLADLRSTVLALHRYQSAAEESDKIRGTYIKYGQRAFGKVSLKTARRVEDLGFSVRVRHDETSPSKLKTVNFA